MAENKPRNYDWERADHALRYLEIHKTGPSPKDYSKPEEVKDGYKHDADFFQKVARSYQKVREAERKVPLLYVYDALQSAAAFPSIDISGNVLDLLEVRNQGDLAVVYLNGISIVAFSPNQQSHIGRVIDIYEEGLQGRLFCNSDFFQKYDLTKTEGTDSDMRNIASSFFKVNGRNHAALLQYLHPEGKSAEHYHTLEEAIVQLAGRSCIVIRPVEHDTDRKVVEMEPGSICRIQPRHLHQLYTRDRGSITIPVKQTNPRRSDHLSYEMSSGRITQELNEIVHDSYESGTALLTTLQSYYGHLKPKEKRKANAYFSMLKGKNQNIDAILKQLVL